MSKFSVIIKAYSEMDTEEGPSYSLSIKELPDPDQSRGQAVVTVGESDMEGLEYKVDYQPKGELVRNLFLKMDEPAGPNPVSTKCSGTSSAIRPVAAPAETARASAIEPQEVMPSTSAQARMELQQWRKATASASCHVAPQEPRQNEPDENVHDETQALDGNRKLPIKKRRRMTDDANQGSILRALLQRPQVAKKPKTRATSDAAALPGQPITNSNHFSGFAQAQVQGPLLREAISSPGLFLNSTHPVDPYCWVCTYISNTRGLLTLDMKVRNVVRVLKKNQWFLQKAACEHCSKLITDWIQRNEATLFTDPMEVNRADRTMQTQPLDLSMKTRVPPSKI